MLRWPFPTFKGAPYIRASRTAGAPQYSFVGWPLAGLGVTAGGVPVLKAGTASDVVSASGALSVNTLVTLVDNATASDLALTLADGIEGQTKTIVFRTRSSTGILRVTPANASGFGSFALHAAGASAVLRFTDGKWYLVSSTGNEDWISFDTTDETITGAGALTVGRKVHRLQTSSGSDVAITLAAMSGGNSIFDGFRKMIVMETKGGAGNYVLTVTQLVGYTTITFNTVGDAVILEWNRAMSRWIVVSNQGCARA